jgi:hypothetical protein
LLVADNEHYVMTIDPYDKTNGGIGGAWGGAVLTRRLIDRVGLSRGIGICGDSFFTDYDNCAYFTQQ